MLAFRCTQVGKMHVLQRLGDPLSVDEREVGPSQLAAEILRCVLCIARDLLISPLPSRIQTLKPEPPIPTTAAHHSPAPSPRSPFSVSQSPNVSSSPALSPFHLLPFPFPFPSPHSHLPPSPALSSLRLSDRIPGADAATAPSGGHPAANLAAARPEGRRQRQCAGNCSEAQRL